MFLIFSKVCIFLTRFGKFLMNGTAEVEASRSRTAKGGGEVLLFLWVSLFCPILPILPILGGFGVPGTADGRRVGDAVTAHDGIFRTSRCFRVFPENVQKWRHRRGQGAGCRGRGTDTPSAGGLIVELNPPEADKS